MNNYFQLEMKGYFRDEVRRKFPESAGIYFVYRGVLNNVTRKCTLKALIFIGETENLHTCLNDHVRRIDFRGILGNGEMLFYTYASTNVSNAERKRIEESLIYELAPFLNDKVSNEYAHSKTRIDILGDRHAFVPSVVIAPSY